jgi:hypothetical protein
MLRAHILRSPIHVSRPVRWGHDGIAAEVKIDGLAGAICLPGPTTTTGVEEQHEGYSDRQQAPHG